MLSRLVKSDATWFQLIQQGCDEIVVNARGRLARSKALITRIERLANRANRRLAVQMIEAQEIVKQLWNSPLKAVELAQAVFSHREQEAYIDLVSVDGARKLGVEPFADCRGGVIKEVLLKLIEDQHDVAAQGLRALEQKVVEWQRGIDLDLFFRRNPHCVENSYLKRRQHFF